MAGVVVGDAVAGEEDAVAGQRVPQGQVVLQLGDGAGLATGVVADLQDVGAVALVLQELDGQFVAGGVERCLGGGPGAGGAVVLFDAEGVVDRRQAAVAADQLGGLQGGV